MNIEKVKAVSYYYKKGSSEGYDRATLDAMYAKAREKYPILEIVEYLCDNNKNLTAYDRAIEMIADYGIRCILTPSLDEASYTTEDSLKNIDWFFQIAHGVEVFGAKEKHFITEDSRSTLKLLITMAEAEKELRQRRHQRNAGSLSIKY